MKTRSSMLALTVVMALCVVGAWLLFRAPGDRAPRDGAIDDARGDPAPAPPVLRGLEREPIQEPEPAAPGAPTRSVVLSVRVLDDARGRALESAEVRVVQDENRLRTVRTNDAGVAEIPDLRPGGIHVVARAPGFVRAEVSRDLAGVEPTEIELRLTRGLRLEGQVVQTRTGLAIAGATVIVIAGGSLDGWTEMSVAPPFGEAVTDEGGRFVVDGVPPDVLVTARAAAEGCGTASRSLRLASSPDAPATIVLQLPPAAGLVGSVVHEGGEPAVGTRVYAVPADAPEMLLADPEAQCISNGRPYRSLRSVTRADGAFLLDGLELGALYVVFAELEGHGRSALREGVVATEDDPRPRVDLVLLGSASLTVRVWSPEGELQEEGRLRLFGDGFPLSLEPQSPGVFVVREPPPGTHTLRVECADAVMQELPVEIRAAEHKEMELRLERGLVLAGMLVDDTGRPIAGQRIWVSRPWQESGKHPPSEGAAETDEEGRFRIRGLRDGPHALGLVKGRHVVPDDLRLVPPEEDLRLVVLRMARLRARLEVPPGFASPDGVGLRVGRAEDGGYAESGRGLPWNGGELQFDDLAPGTCRVRIQVEGLLEVAREVTLKPGEVADLGTIDLEAGIALEGRVVDREGLFVAGARVTAGQVWTAVHRLVVTGADGRFVLPTLARGAYEIEITAAGFLPRTVRVVMPEQASGRSFVLDRGCLVTVRVTTADGKPAPAQRVRWRPMPAPAGAEGADLDESDARGRLEVRLPVGTWTFEVLDDQWEGVTSAEVVLAEGGAASVELALPR